MSEVWNLKGGAIVIGSLLWQNHLRDEDNIRKNWRQSRLKEDSKILVKLPIRYGRYSEGGIYTMVFSNNCYRYRQLGTGYILPFKANPIRDSRQLLSEAQAMSEAEGMNGSLLAGRRDIWCKMGILLNDSRIDKKTKRNVLDCWNRQFLTENRKLVSCDFRFIKNELSCISNQGELAFKWTEPVDMRNLEEVSDFDFLIATATMPKLKTRTERRYPNVQEVAASVRNDKRRFYFIENVKSGITTFQDNKILNNCSK